MRLFYTRLPYGSADPQRSLLDGPSVSVTDLLHKSGVRSVSQSMFFLLYFVVMSRVLTTLGNRENSGNFLNSGKLREF